MQKHKREHSVQLMSQVLKVGRSGYYDWLDRPPSRRRKRRIKLCKQIRQVCQEHNGLYGSPRVTAELKGRKVKVCRNTVASVMKQNGLRARTRRRFVPATTNSRHDQPIALNVLDQRFTWKKRDLAWCADITAIPTDEGWLYLAVVMDLFSRRIVGWAMAEEARAAVCVDALEMAVRQRRPRKGLLHHSDRGVQYACNAYQNLLERLGMISSMSRLGNCYDNAAMESFFGTLKRELVHQEHYLSREQARASVFQYIEVYYNRRRRHSALGHLSPVAFESSAR
jgi:putative transposase